jgi:opacity protein-like surface antigen
VSPFVGPTFAADEANGRSNFGFDVGWMANRIAGVEFDFGYAPNFFGSSGNFGDNHVLTAMGNFIVGIPIERFGEGVRPYATIGAGLIRTQVTGTPDPFGVPKLDDNHWGMNAGVGVMGFFSNRAGIRGDVRYIRNLQEDAAQTVQFGHLHFWRATLGIVLR